MSQFNLNIPITKVDEEQRIVYGYATVEELDRQGDIVDYEASKKAFSKWPGNIREQHDAKRAVGKNVHLEFNDNDKKVLIGAKISRSNDGQNAWTKVQEGIFTGFSIGGKIYKTIREAVKGDDGEEVSANRIVDYDLAEVSLVDVPACPSAQFVMVKSLDGKLEHVEEMHEVESQPWFFKHYAIAPEQVNRNSESKDNESIEKGDKLNMSKVAKAVYGEVERDATGKEKDEPKLEVKYPAAEEPKETPKEEVKEEPKVEESKESEVEQEAPEQDAQPAKESEKKSVEPEITKSISELKELLSQFSPTEEKTVELSDQPIDLEKMVSQKFEATRDDLLKSLTEAVAGKVGEQLKPLEDRIAAIEAQPVGNAPKREYTVVDKVASAPTAEEELQKRVAEMEANPGKYTADERSKLASELFKRSSRIRGIIN